MEIITGKQGAAAICNCDFEWGEITVLQCLFFFCFLLGSQPAPAVPDGAGGFVPFTNARVMPDGTLRPYDPALDGIMLPDGRIYFPYLPAPYPAEPPGRVTVGPPQPMPLPAPHHSARAAKPHGKPASRGCYDQAGKFIEPPLPECLPPSRAPETAPEPNRERSL